MKYLSQYAIPFAGLKVGNHEFDFEVDEKFFACFEESELSKSHLQVKANLDKQTVMMVLEINVDGTVNVPCDRCSEPFDLPVSVSDKFYIKFGDEAMDDDEIIVLEHGEHEINIAQKIYELIIINLPSRRVHDEGKCNEEILKNLEKYKPGDKDEKNDPRWDALKNIKFN